MSRVVVILVALLAVLGCVAAMFPLSWAWQAAGLSRAGLSAEAVTGRVWDGAARGVRVGGRAVGDLKLVLDGQALLGGRVGVIVLPLRNATWKTTVFASADATRIVDLKGAVPVRMLLPAGTTEAVPADLELFFDAVDVSVPRGEGACTSASGRVALAPWGDIGLPQLIGPLSCDTGVLTAALMGPEGRPAVQVQVVGAEVRVSSTDPTLQAGLAAAGLAAN
jgi:hypothetical protein